MRLSTLTSYAVLRKESPAARRMKACQTSYRVDLIERQEWLEPVESGLQRAVGESVRFGGNGRAQDPQFSAWRVAGTSVAPRAHGHSGRGVDSGSDSGRCGRTEGRRPGGEGRARGRGWVGSHRPDRLAGDGRIGAPGRTCPRAAEHRGDDAVHRRRWSKRKQRDRSAARALALAGYAVAFASAYLGGQSRVPQADRRRSRGRDGSRRKSGRRCSIRNEFADGEPRRVDVNGARVLLVRREGEIYAIGEVCSHLGGPLAEGELQGDVIQCPWHGSRFCVRDGSVVDGPATHPQPVFEARLNGDVLRCGPGRKVRRSPTPPSRSWPDCAAGRRRSRGAPRCDTPATAAARSPGSGPAVPRSAGSR